MRSRPEVTYPPATPGLSSSPECQCNAANAHNLPVATIEAAAQAGGSQWRGKGR
jgi:hypothetical protein